MNALSEPVIGICAVRERARWSFWDQPAHLVADSYVGSVQRTGAIAVLLPIDRRAPAELLERIDALLLIGGADLDPATYGAGRDPATETTYPERDQFESIRQMGAVPALGAIDRVEGHTATGVARRCVHPPPAGTGRGDGETVKTIAQVASLNALGFWL